MKRYIIQLDPTWAAVDIDNVIDYCGRKNIKVNTIDWDRCVLYVETENIMPIKFNTLIKSNKKWTVYEEIKLPN